MPTDLPTAAAAAIPLASPSASRAPSDLQIVATFSLAGLTLALLLALALGTTDLAPDFAALMAL